nr:hypothetical protein [Tanacetum cinerariifolium]
MISPGGSIVASLENVNGFLAVNTPPDDLIRIDFEQKGVVLKVMLHIFEEFVLFLGRHSLNNEIPCMEENPSEQFRLRIFLSKEIFEGGVIRIHNALVHDEVIGQGVRNRHSCCQVFNSAGVLFLLLEYSVLAVSSSLLLLASITAIKKIVIVN